jgi:hypothetical protein
MFEKMMKYEKAFANFVRWVECRTNKPYFARNNHFYYFSDEGPILIDELFILSVIPIFFDERTNIELVPNKTKCRIVYTNSIGVAFLDIEDTNRITSLKQACEKAFELYNKQIKEQS